MVVVCIWEVSVFVLYMRYCNIKKNECSSCFYVWYVCLKYDFFRKKIYGNDILLQEWWNSCEKGNLLLALKKYWRIFVFSVFGNNYDLGKEERLVYKFLFRSMEYFLCR